MSKPEMALFSAIMDDVVTDLSDRGIISAAAACVVQANLGRLAAKIGHSLLTERLPTLGKALDAYLLTDQTTQRNLHAEITNDLWVASYPLLGMELSERLIGNPAELEPQLVGAIRDLSFLFYKYELPHAQDKVKAAIDKFLQIEADLVDTVSDYPADRTLLGRVFRGIDLSDIQPRHGPGTVADKATGPGKYNWGSLPERLVNVYSYDYFVASPEHLTTELVRFMQSPSEEPAARLLTVPKDSRGPRVISCEPKEFQWIQQGIMDSLVSWLERHPLTRTHVRFTDQSVNGRLALQASHDGRYATLDLSEASDRVTLAYVEKHFPADVFIYLNACRSLATRLPCGQVVPLRKFAPMGSANCFPVLACVVWTRLKTAGIHDCHVYGDDVIVPTAQAALAITALEEIGLKVNRSKSCTSGFFRESCGVDAYRGVDVTPVRFKRRWSSRPHADTYVAWIAYANHMWRKGYCRAASRLARELVSIYGPVLQVEGRTLNVPHFSFVVSGLTEPRRRWNYSIQQVEYNVLCPVARRSTFNRKDSYCELDWFARTARSQGESPLDKTFNRSQAFGLVRSYTKRGNTLLKRRWMPIYDVRCETRATEYVQHYLVSQG